MDNHRLGLDYHITDANENNSALVVMFQTKLLGHSIGIWYYDIAENGVISHGLTQDNFPITDDGFNGIRWQVGFKLFQNIKTDIRYYMQTMDADNNKINRIQLNLNVKL